MPQVDEVTAESASWFPRPFEINPQIFDFDQLRDQCPAAFSVAVSGTARIESGTARDQGRRSPHIVPGNAGTRSPPWGIRGRTHPWYESRTMPRKTNVGLSRTISQDCNSHGFSLNLEGEQPANTPGYPRAPPDTPNAPNVLAERVQVRYCKAAEESAQ